MILIISSQVGISIFCLPYGLSKRVGHDGWIPVLFSGIASILLSILLMNLLRRYKNKSIFEIDTYLYGKYLGNMINILLVLYLTLKGVVALRFYEEVIHITVLRITPPLVITSLIIIPTVYLTWYGLKSICRFSVLIFGSMLSVIILFLLHSRYIRIEFLMPVGISSIPSLLDAMLSIAYSFLSFANVAVVYPFITDKAKTLKYVIAGITVSTLFFMASVIITSGFFGENMLKHLIFPILTLSASYRAPITERLDLFFLAIWFPALGMTLRMYFFVTYLSINKLFKVKKKTISIILLTLLIILLSRIPRDFAQVYKYMEVTDFIGVPLVSMLTLLNYVLSFIFKKGTSEQP
jgi:spore germination protein (amino acid permease)